MPHIYVIDDEQDVLTLIKFLLEKEEHTVTTAHDGEAALKILGIEPEKKLDAGQKPDLIILDVMMPKIDGLTVAKKMNARQDLKSVPLIILTAKGQMREIFESEVSVAAFLEKPFDPQRLKQMVAGILGGK